MADSGHAQLHELRKGDALMSEQTVSTVTERPDWLDGSTEIELSARHLRAYWDADILDVDDRDPYDTIIARKDPFLVRFRVYLRGRLWKCLCGNWCFDVCFTSIGDGPKFDLSDIVPDRSDFHIRDWKGRAATGCTSRSTSGCRRRRSPSSTAGRSTRSGRSSSSAAAVTARTRTATWPSPGTKPRASTCSTRPDPGPLRERTGPRAAQLRETRGARGA